MNIRKFLTRCAAGVLSAMLMTAAAVGASPTVPASAPAAAGIKTAEDRVNSKIAAGKTLDQADAALRLYYLGMLTGSGTDRNGGIEFNLSGGLNRLEAAVFAVRLLGGEEEAHKKQYAHPFSDVPDWAADYVGFLYNRGLLSDLTREGKEFLFHPDFSETTERFMSYMLFALGYRTETGDYSIHTAAESTRTIGVCMTGEKEPLTRGGAVLAMYNTLRTTIKNSERVYSDLLVERGTISYQDAVFLLWDQDEKETGTYMDAMGYGFQWVIPNGYYKIRAARTTGSASTDPMMLNVAVSGMNHDYEGVGVTLWQSTDDITQTFRIERTERGTYYLYSAASRNGYGRVIGSADGQTERRSGLYSSTGKGATEFFLQGTADGSWKMVPADHPDRCLTVRDANKNGAPVIFAGQTEKGIGASTWFFDRQGVTNARGEELAVFVADSLVVTQGAFDDFSHMNQNALDIQPTEGVVKAPFGGTIVRVEPWEAACNAVWVESNQPVRYADGSYDYMTVSFLHDNDISDLSVGQILTQGEAFYDCGDCGASTGKHVHIAVYRGKYRDDMRLGSGDVYAENAFFLPDKLYIYNDYGLAWKDISMAD